MTNTKETKLMIIENFIDYYTTDEAERLVMKEEATSYVDEDWVDEIGQSKEKEYKILSSSSPSGLSKIVNDYVKEGWKPIGGHQVVELHRQNRYSGTQHMDTRIEVEYTQTIVKEM